MTSLALVMFAILHLQFVNIWNRDLCQLGSVAVGTNEFLVEPNFEPGALGSPSLGEEDVGVFFAGKSMLFFLPKVRPKL